MANPLDSMNCIEYLLNVATPIYNIRINDNEAENDNIVALLAETVPRQQERNVNKSIEIISDITFRNNERYSLECKG